MILQRAEEAKVPRISISYENSNSCYTSNLVGRVVDSGRGEDGVGNLFTRS